MSSSGRVGLGQLLEQRRAATSDRIKRLRDDLVEAEKLCGDTACVYAIGSFGRGEASPHSDLDLFIVSHGTPALSRLTQILIKAHLIEATRKHGIPPFSGDGEYLTHYSVTELVSKLGKRDDDAVNTFTARLLLLLESTPLLGKGAYDRTIRDVVNAYWRDYTANKNVFIPAFLANDVLRMWRTFCVNYEAGTRSEPPRQAAKRRLKNYKLKHSRLISCFSALLQLLMIYSKNGTVSPNDAVRMASLTPTERLEWILSQSHVNAAGKNVRESLKQYEEFLSKTDASENEMVQRFLDKKQSKPYRESRDTFGNLVFDLLETIGNGSKFHRLIVV